MLTKFLLIDDNDHQHELFRCYAMLADTLELAHARSLEEAVNTLADDLPDVVLLDNRLHPYRDYRQTVPKLRQAGFVGKIVLISSDVNEPIFSNANTTAFNVHSCVDKSDFRLDTFQQTLDGIAHSAC